MIEVRNVNKKNKGHIILKDITLSVSKGVCVGLVGHNGSGKTMLLKAICGFTKIDSGDISVDGHEIMFSEKYIRNSGIIIEQPSFVNYLTGLDNLLVLADIQKKISKQEVLLTLEKVGLSDAKNKKVKEYSLGMKQRLRIAQAIMENPDVLILDEPFNGLDKESIYEVQNLLLDAKREGVTILLTSHDDRQINYLCDFVYELNGGVLVE